MNLLLVQQASMLLVAKIAEKREIAIRVKMAEISHLSTIRKIFLAQEKKGLNGKTVTIGIEFHGCSDAAWTSAITNAKRLAERLAHTLFYPRIQVARCHVIRQINSTSTQRAITHYFLLSRKEWVRMKKVRMKKVRMKKEWARLA